ncbi:MAG: hypothetical protein ACXW25_00555 [Rhodospirillales bacterium]|nr:hypothetical protein [Rhodospirillales bacterium]
MKTLLRIAAAAALLMIIGGGAYLAFSDLPAPTSHVEKVIPDDRFRN